jgi:hypothetical protein
MCASSLCVAKRGRKEGKKKERKEGDKITKMEIDTERGGEYLSFSAERKIQWNRE